MYTLIVISHFDAAHHISGYPGVCGRVHGHRFTIELRLSGETLDKINMLIDFKEVKGMLKELFDKCLDHYDLNEMLPERENVTAEYLSKWIYEQVKGRLYQKTKVINVDSVTVFESPECGVKYEPDKVVVII